MPPNRPTTEVQQPPGERPQISPPVNPDAGIAPVERVEKPRASAAPNSFRCHSVSKASGGNPEEVRLIANGRNIEIRILNFEAEAQEYFSAGKEYELDFEEAEGGA
jgi:hypothetical protein